MKAGGFSISVTLIEKLLMESKKTKSLDVTEITFGECPPELTINFDETIHSVDLNKIVLTDIKIPNVITGLRIRPIQTS